MVNRPPSRAAPLHPAPGGPARLTYAELDVRAESLAVVLRKYGAAPGSRVALWLPVCPELVVATIGVLRTGAAYDQLDVLLGPGHAVRALADGAARLLVSCALSPALPGLPGTVHVVDVREPERDWQDPEPYGPAGSDPAGPGPAGWEPGPP